MGNEFAQFIEWDYRKGLDWLLLDFERHRQMQDFVKKLNHLYLDIPALWQRDADWESFRWCNANDAEQSMLSFTRWDANDFLRVINLGEFILCCIRTVINVKRWFIFRQQLFVESDRAKLLEAIEEMEKILDDEVLNAESAIPLVEADSRLGWEPSMEYQSDAWHIRWKLKEIDYVRNTELASFRKRIFAKIDN